MRIDEIAGLEVVKAVIQLKDDWVIRPACASEILSLSFSVMQKQEDSGPELDRPGLQKPSACPVL